MHAVFMGGRMKVCAVGTERMFECGVLNMRLVVCAFVLFMCGIVVLFMILFMIVFVLLSVNRSGDNIR